jgi:hypothetical protein
LVPFIGDAEGFFAQVVVQGTDKAAGLNEFFDRGGWQVLLKQFLLLWREANPVCMQIWPDSSDHGFDWCAPSHQCLGLPWF